MEAFHSADIDKWLKLRGAEGVGSVTFRRVLESFGSVERVLGASAMEISKLEGIGRKKAEKIAGTRENFDAAGELELAGRLGVSVINWSDVRYPVLLKRIYDPPPVLYVKGDFCRGDNLALSIVGSRRCSLYGEEQASRLSHFLSSAGFTVCSGMARGIDTAAHQGALSAGGRTIAVLGCGLAKVYPAENKRLAELICRSGACVSELSLNYEPLSENFPARNRIIAGLSLGTIVVEAGLRSGALLTSKAALGYDREVMAVPGKIDSPLSKGCHALIKDGAQLVEGVEDVMETLGYLGDKLGFQASKAAREAQRSEKPLFDIAETNLSADEKAVYDILGSQTQHVEQITGEAAFGAGRVNASLISLRLKGLIKQMPGDFFARR